MIQPITFPHLQTLFTQNADAKEATKMSAYMQNKFVFLGIPKPKREVLAKQFFANCEKTDAINWQFIFDCFAASGREYQYTAMDYLESRVKQLSAKDIPNVKKLIETKSWWDSIDCLDQIVGDIVIKDDSVNNTILEWSIDKNFWLRRIAIDFQLRFKNKTNKELLAQIIKNNFTSDEFFIQKAIGWALREYSKTNPEWVKNFLKENQANMAKLSVKEASKYLNSLSV